MKKPVPMLLLMLLACLLASCNGWVVKPAPFNPPTPFLPPTNTPSVFSPTPVVIAPASATPTPQIATATPVIFITATNTATLIPSDTPAVTEIIPPTGAALSVEILGCDTSIDVAHGMGEVTNAYVVIRNTGGVELTNLRVVLNARDEGREHPDKRKEIPSLPVGYKVTLKLTADSTYQEDTPIQIETSTSAGLFDRVGAESCKDIGLFAPNPNDLSTPMPINP